MIIIVVVTVIIIITGARDLCDTLKPKKGICEFSGLEWWNGTVEWTTGVEYWTGLLEFHAHKYTISLVYHCSSKLVRLRSLNYIYG